MRSLNTIIPFEVYPFDLMISFNETDKQIIDALKKYDIGPGSDDRLFNMDKETQLRGRTVMFIGGQMVLRMNFMPQLRKPEQMALLQHELFHAVEFLMIKINTPLTEKGDEPYAYLIQFLTEKIYSLLK